MGIRFISFRARESEGVNASVIHYEDGTTGRGGNFDEGKRKVIDTLIERVFSQTVGVNSVNTAEPVLEEIYPDISELKFTRK